MTRIRTEHTYRIDLAKGTREVALDQPLMHQDAQADVFTAAVRQGMAPVDLTGATVYGYLTRHAQDDTLVLTGKASGNRASVTLADSCYARPGRFTLAVQVKLGEVRHTVLRVTGHIARTCSDEVSSPDGSIPDLPSLLEQLDVMQAATGACQEATADAGAAAQRANAAAERAEALAEDGGLPTVYCWGDSLTEGVGGWLATPEMVQKAIVSAYPDVVADRYPCINLGCRGETIQTIMARQGADPMVVGGFTIPADSGEDVIVGYLRGGYYDDDRLGLATKSGDLAQPLKESEAGINPCTIAGVEGELFRDMTPDSQGRYAYRFRRLKSGTAKAVPAMTPIRTYAMRYWRNGVAVIWMGANGAVSSHAAYLQKIRQMVEYGRYENYIVLLCREYTEQWVLEDVNNIRDALTDADGTCHLLYLKPELLRRGYTLGGVAASAGVPDTSAWTNTTDEIKLQRPLLMASTGTAEASYETLHFSCYGYRAIGKLVLEKLGQLLKAPDDGTSLKIITQPADVTLPVGSTACYRVEAEGEGLSYQWEFINASGGSWAVSSMEGSRTPVLVVPVLASRNGYRYRCLVMDSNGASVMSDTARLTVGTALPDIVTNGTDAHGAYICKTTRKLTGAGTVIDTGFKPYDQEKDWTLLCRFSDDILPTDGSLGCIFEMRTWFEAAGKQTAVYLRKVADPSGEWLVNVGGGSGAFNFPVDNAPGYSAPTDGWHDLAIIKSGANYAFYLDGGLAYGAPLGYAVAPEHLSEDPLYLFGRMENGNVLNTVTGTLGGFRVYEGTLTAEEAFAILAEMAG